MVTEILVENYLEDGTRLVAALESEGISVTVAFWVKTREDNTWFLYIAAPLVDNNSLASAYRDVYGVLRKCSLRWLSESDIKLIGATNSIAQDVLRLRKHWVGLTIVRKTNLQIGSMFVEELLIYPDS